MAIFTGTARLSGRGESAESDKDPDRGFAVSWSPERVVGLDGEAVQGLSLPVEDDRGTSEALAVGSVLERNLLRPTDAYG
jgi:hypothetical protein